MFMSPREAEKLCGVASYKLRLLSEEGKIKCEKSEGGHRKYDSRNLKDYFGISDGVELKDKMKLVLDKLIAGERLDIILDKDSRLSSDAESLVQYMVEKNGGTLTLI